MSSNSQYLKWNNKIICDPDGLVVLPSDIHGVYILENVNYSVFYVGKTEDQSIRERMEQHYGTQEKNEVIVRELKNNWPITIYYASVDKRITSNDEKYLKSLFNPAGNNIEPTSEKPIECNIPIDINDIY